MDVFDGLAAVVSGVDHGAITLGEALGSGDFSGGPMQMAEKLVMFLFGLGNGGDVLAGNDEDMHRRLRLHIGKGIALIVLVDGSGRDGSIDDLAEDATHSQLKSLQAAAFRCQSRVPAGRSRATAHSDGE